MVPSSPMVRVIRFGTFEADLDRGELRKRGMLLRVQEQPFRILKLLLEQPGEVISRDDLRSALWPDNTFVDFDHSLNAAVAKLRQILGDSAENPRYIETVARRGYRFIAPVEFVGPTAAAADENGSTPPAIASPTQVSLGKKRWTAIAAVICLGAIVVAITSARLPHPSQAPILTRITADAGLSSDPAISSDGKLIAYASDRSGDHLHIWVQEARAGGQAVQLTSGAADEDEPSFSADGSRIVFRSRRNGGTDSSINVIPALGGEPVPLVTGGRNPRFSPDGKWIAYWTGLEWGGMAGVAAGKVFVVSSSGGPARLVSGALAVAGMPVWSPDGANLLVAGVKDPQAHFKEAPDWWVLPLAGAAPTRTGVYARFQQTGLNFNPIWMLAYPSEWSNRGVLFSAKMGDSIDLWRIQLARDTWQITGAPEQLLSGAGFAVSGSTANDGRVAFASLSRKTHVWSLPLDAASGTVRAEPEPLTDSAAAELWPSITADGRRLAFSSTKAGSSHIVIKDLETGKESDVAPAHADEQFPIFSYDGSRLAYTVVEQNKPSIYALLPPSKLPRKLLDDGDWVWGWSPDGRYLLHKAGGIRKVRIIETATLRSTDLLDDPPGGGVFQASFSFDGHWLVFMNLKAIFIAPFRGPGLIPKQEWITVSESGAFDDKPRWAPDANSIYFTSDRDGSRCVWMQRLNGNSKRPVGDAVPIYHSHSGRRSILNAGSPVSEIGVARDRLVFLQNELTGNVWVADWKK